MSLPVIGACQAALLAVVDFGPEWAHLRAPGVASLGVVPRGPSPDDAESESCLLHTSDAADDM
eukprot:3223128-Alexandrium_andersonii.AAC.1